MTTLNTYTVFAQLPPIGMKPETVELINQSWRANFKEVGEVTARSGPEAIVEAKKKYPWVYSPVVEKIAERSGPYGY